MLRLRAPRLCLLISALALVALAAAACGSDDDDGGAAATPASTATAAGDGGSTEVRVTLSEWAVAPDSPSVAAGEVSFTVANGGSAPHQFVAIRTDLAADALPVDAGAVDEGALDIVARIALFAAGTTELVSATLEAGNYVLICVIPDHYDLGMRVAFTVTVDFSARAVGEAFNPSVQPVLVNSALGVGPNRVTFGLFRDDRSLIMDATATLRLYRVDGDRGTFVSEHALLPASIAQQTEHEHGDGSTHAHDDPFATIYYANVEFDAAGRWGAVLTVSSEGKTYEGLLTQQFVVLETTPEPHIGQPLPASSHLTLRDVDDISEIGSSEQPIEELHELTVAEALVTGRPVFVVISTPAFCQTRFCGPMLQGVVVPLWEEFGEVVQFVHVEPFDLNEARNTARLVAVPLMGEWGLQSEPWIFVADRDGLVVAKFEGIAAVEEVRDVLMDVVSADPSK